MATRRKPASPMVQQPMFSGQWAPAPQLRVGVKWVHDFQGISYCEVLRIGEKRVLVRYTDGATKWVKREQLRPPRAA